MSPTNVVTCNSSVMEREKPYEHTSGRLYEYEIRRLLSKNKIIYARTFMCDSLLL